MHVNFRLNVLQMPDLAAVDRVKHCILNELGGELETEIVASKLTYKISTDHDCENPRNNDNLGVMHCGGHRHYDLGDSGVPTPFVDDDWKAGVLRDDVFMSLPIYLYDHSGLTVAHTPFGDRWDSGLLGWHYMLESVAKENWPSLTGKALRDAVEACLCAEMSEYDDFVRGNTWYVEITDEEGEVVEECGSFIGAELDATGILDNFDSKHADGLRAAWEQRYD